MTSARARWTAAVGCIAAVGVWLAGATSRGDEPSDPLLLPPPPVNAPLSQPEKAAPPTLPPAAEPTAPEKPKAGKADGPEAKPAEKKAEVQKEEKKEEKKEEPSLWSRVPPATPMPRLGLFAIPPSGPGFYSFRDFLDGNWREKPPRFPFGQYSINPVSFFDYDFRYHDDPENTQFDWSDCYKRVHFCDCWLFSTGGEIRFRYANEDNSRLTGRDNDFTLFRTRLYGDLWYADRFRLFAELNASFVFGEELPPLPIDESGPELQNGFVEAKVGELSGSPIYARVGRQELLYGSQRLISTLDWANVRRTFDGVKGYWHSEKLDVDVFWVRPVRLDPDRFDSSNPDRDFIGAWATHKPRKGTFVDLYALNLNRTTPVDRGNVTTLGARYAGDCCERFLFDFEGMYQYGDRGTKTVTAHAATGGVGWRFADCPMVPHFWIYYDYASGNPNPANDIDRTFDQLFAFGHYYFGYLDLVGRQNIKDLNFQLQLFPQPWISTIFQFHIFQLAEARDALYNAAAVPLRRDPTGRAGTDVGEEFDFTTNFHLSNHQDLFIGYSHFFAGEFIRRTGNPRSADLLYAQYSFRW